MTTRSIGQIGVARLIALCVAVMMIAAAACSSSTPVDEPAPANSDSNSAPAVESNGDNTGSGDGSSVEPNTEPAPEVTEPTVDAMVEQATGVLFLEMISPDSDELFVTQSSYELSGRTTVDALLSVNDEVLDVDEEGKFALSIELEEGPNVIEVIASNALGEQQDEVLLVFYEPV